MMEDSRGRPIETRTDPGLVCPYCRFDNTPLPEDRPPEKCEGCGAPL